MESGLLEEEQSYSLPYLGAKAQTTQPLTQYSLHQSLGDSLQSAPVFIGGRNGVQGEKAQPADRVDKEYIQAIGTPQQYQFERTNLEPKSHFGFSDESIDRAEMEGDRIPFTETPPPLARPFSPWTPRGAILFAQSKLKAGSIKGSVFNMIVATVGSGLLSLPFGVRMFGLIPSILLLMFSAWLSYQTNDLLLVASQHLPRGVKPTHLNLARACSPIWGKHLAIFTQCMLLCQIFGSMVSYNVGFGGLLDLVWGVAVPKSAGVTHVYPFVVLIVSWAVIYPLALMRSMAAMRFTSALGFVCGLYLSMVLFFEYFALCNNQEIEPQNTCFWSAGFKLHRKHLFNFEDAGHFVQQLLFSVPYFIFAFTNQQYCLPVYVELTRQSRRTMQKVVSYAHSIIFLEYTLSAFFSFLSFLDGTCGNILLNNFHKRLDAVMAAVAISVSMILTQPVAAFAWRMNFAEVLFKVKQLPQNKHIAVTTVLVFAVMLVSLLVTDIATVIGLLGATTFPMVGYILPAIYVWNLAAANGRHRVRRYLAAVEATVVALLSAGSLALQLYAIAGHMQHQGDCHNLQTIKAASFF